MGFQILDPWTTQEHMDELQDVNKPFEIKYKCLYEFVYVCFSPHGQESITFIRVSAY